MYPTGGAQTFGLDLKLPVLVDHQGSRQIAVNVDLRLDRHQVGLDGCHGVGAGDEA